MNNLMTAEQFLVKELMETRDRLDKKSANYVMLMEEYGRVTALVSEIKKSLTLEVNNEGNGIIRLSAWEQYDVGAFNQLCELFGLKKEDFE